MRRCPSQAIALARTEDDQPGFHWVGGPTQAISTIEITLIAGENAILGKLAGVSRSNAVGDRPRSARRLAKQTFALSILGSRAGLDFNQIADGPALSLPRVEADVPDASIH